MEVWKPIVGFEGLYEVSNIGKVKSLPKRNVPVARLMAVQIDDNGYHAVTLSRAGKIKRKLVHCMMLESFVGPRPGHPRLVHGCHRDGNNQNNVLSNLRWGTVESNQADRLLHGTALLGELNHSTILSEVDVKAIRRRLQTYNVGDIQLIANEYGVKHATISDIHTRRTWKYL